MLCRQLLRLLDESSVTAYIPNPFLNPTALRMALADELGVRVARNIGQHRLLQLITERLHEITAQGRRAVLLLDEAQAIPDGSLEALRLLTNLETEKRKLLQVVLVGQPELDVRLAQKRFRQLKQRIVFSYRLRPLDRKTMAKYIQHRLRIAGYHGPALYGARALARLHRASCGIPRLINLLCHKSLMAAYGAGAQRVGRDHLKRAVRDTQDVTPGRRSWLAIASGLAGILALTSASLLYAYGL